ncbi:MAG: (deoxy)nucleoside triphosphate pyrophosphohydrolase [Desulfobacteraceae bacterium]
MIVVTAAIITDNGKVFIAKRKPPGRMPGMWEFPGGKVEEGETPELCLQRELREELDIDAEVGEHIGTNRHKYDFYTVDLMAYRTKIIAGRIKLNDHAEMAWVSPDEIGRFEFAPADVPFVEMIRRGELVL